MTRVLANGIRISIGEASRRVRAAEHLADRNSMTGELLAPVRPRPDRPRRRLLLPRLRLWHPNGANGTM